MRVWVFLKPCGVPVRGRGGGVLRGADLAPPWLAMLPSLPGPARHAQPCGRPCPVLCPAPAAGPGGSRELMFGDTVETRGPRGRPPGQQAA